jgi:cold shock protein
MQSGRVKWFNESKGFGFITSDKKDYFVHFRSIRTEGFKTLKEGDAVTFNPTTSQKGLVADDVRLDLEG